MHTVIVIGIGLVTLVAFVFAGYELSGSSAMVTAALRFLPVWMIGAAINLWIGVSKAGYPARDELPVFGLVFAVPAAIALGFCWRFHSP
jgi:hypothetical protein